MSDTENTKKVLTLGELGACLPLGIEQEGGTLGKSVSFRPWKLKQEKEIAAAKAKMKGKISGAQYASMVLSTMCNELGGVSFEGKPENEKRQAIGQMYLGDVLYAYLYLRYEAIGEVLKTDLHCPNCSHQFILPADLRTLEVTVADDSKAAQAVYTLKNPLEIRGKTIHKMVFGPAKWVSLEAMSSGAVNEGQMKEAFMRASFVSAPGVDNFILSHGDLDEMSKKDFESIGRLLEDSHVGPDLNVESACPNCSHNFKTQLNWATEDFFTESSQ